VVEQPVYTAGRLETKNGNRAYKEAVMLGELIGEERGKTTGIRVLEAEAAGPKVEVTFRTSGKILGMEMTAMGSYRSAVQQGGFLYGEGQGFVTTKDGDMATWKGQGAGKMKPGGGVSYRGAVYFQNASGKLARLNGTAAVYEHESGANDEVSTKYWEWK